MTWAPGKEFTHRAGAEGHVGIAALRDSGYKVVLPGGYSRKETAFGHLTAERLGFGQINRVGVTIGEVGLGGVQHLVHRAVPVAPTRW